MLHTPGHVLDALSPVVLVVTVAGDVLQVMHVGSYQHGPQLHKVTVGRVLHCKQENMNVPSLEDSWHEPAALGQFDLPSTMPQG